MISLEREVSEDQEAQAYMRMFTDPPEGALVTPPPPSPGALRAWARTAARARAAGEPFFGWGSTKGVWKGKPRG